MSRKAVILYRVRDYQEILYDVREERETIYGFPVLLGWPFGVPRGRGGAGHPQVILTHDLRNYLDATRLKPGRKNIPIWNVTIKKLRARLGYNFYCDWPLLWQSKEDDLIKLTLEEFCKKHNCSMGTASQARRRILRGENK